MRLTIFVCGSNLFSDNTRILPYFLNLESGLLVFLPSIWVETVKPFLHQRHMLPPLLKTDKTRFLPMNRYPESRIPRWFRNFQNPDLGSRSGSLTREAVSLFFGESPMPLPCFFVSGPIIASRLDRFVKMGNMCDSLLN